MKICKLPVNLASAVMIALPFVCQIFSVFPFNFFLPALVLCSDPDESFPLYHEEVGFSSILWTETYCFQETKDLL